MNDGHAQEILETKFWVDHPEFHCFNPDQGHTLDYGHKEVRDHMFLLIQEAVQRYDCDGIELDFNRFPIFFKDGTPGEQRIAKMNELVGRIRKMLDKEGKSVIAGSCWEFGLRLRIMRCRPLMKVRSKSAATRSPG